MTRRLMCRLGAAAAVLAMAIPASPAAGRADATQPGCAGKVLASRVVNVRFRPVPDAAQVIEQLLGPCGSFRVPKGLKVVTVTDEPKQLDRIAQAIAEWDVPPRPIELTVSLILATREPQPQSGLVGEIRGVSESLSQLTRFTHFERLGTATVRGLEGSTGEAQIDERYYVSFRIVAVDAERGIVRLEPFELFQRPAKAEPPGPDRTPRRLLGMSVNLPDGQMNLVGAPARGNERALFLALTAWTTNATARRPAPAGAADLRGD